MNEFYTKKQIKEMQNNYSFAYIKYYLHNYFSFIYNKIFFLRELGYNEDEIRRFMI